MRNTTRYHDCRKPTTKFSYLSINEYLQALSPYSMYYTLCSIGLVVS